VPAHNEAGVIARTVANLKKRDMAGRPISGLVCADNCEDATAELARAAGASVIERQNPTQRGKGYASSSPLNRVARTVSPTPS